MEELSGPSEGFQHVRIEREGVSLMPNGTTLDVLVALVKHEVDTMLDKLSPMLVFLVGATVLVASVSFTAACIVGSIVTGPLACMLAMAAVILAFTTLVAYVDSLDREWHALERKLDQLEEIEQQLGSENG